MPKKKKENIQFMSSLAEHFETADLYESDDHDAPMAGYLAKTFAIEDHDDLSQTRTHAGTSYVFTSRDWIDNFPDDPIATPLWDDTQNNFDLWRAIRPKVTEWRRAIEDEGMPAIEFCGEDLLIFDTLDIKPDYRRLGAASTLCRFVRTATVSPRSGALIVVLVNEAEKEALAFWHAFGLTHQIGRHGRCIALAGLWQGAYHRWAINLEPNR